MSNTISIEVQTAFANHDPAKTWCDVVIQDSYDREALMYPDDEELDTDEKVFSYAVKWCGEAGRGTLDYAIESEKDILVNGNWYSYEEWKPWYDKVKSGE